MAYPKRIIWSPSAQSDLENIIDYLMYSWGKKVTSKFLNRMTNLTRQIAINPEQYPVIHQKLNIRKCVLTKQNTHFYRMKNNQVEIIRIYDTRQNPKNLKILFELL